MGSAFFELVVIPDGGQPYDLDVMSRDVLMFERTTKGRNLATWRDSPSFDDLYRCSYFAARRLGLWPGTQAEWESSVDIDFREDPDEGEGDGVDPTRPDRMDGS